MERNKEPLLVELEDESFILVNDCFWPEAEESTSCAGQSAGLAIEALAVIPERQTAPVEDRGRLVEFANSNEPTD